MSVVRWTFALYLILCAGPACGAEWSIGTHLGLTSIQSDRKGGGGSTILAWPASTLSYQPALRISCADARHAHEVFLDSGQFLIEEAGSPFHMLTALVGYQHVFAARNSTSLVGNLAAGMYSEGGAVTTAASSCFGAGVGVRHVLREDHGALRAELRVDRLNEATVLGRPGLTSLGLRLGFDLWL